MAAKTGSLQQQDRVGKGEEGADTVRVPAAADVIGGGGKRPRRGGAQGGRRLQRDGSNRHVARTRVWRRQYTAGDADFSLPHTAHQHNVAREEDVRDEFPQKTAQVVRDSDPGGRASRSHAGRKSHRQETGGERARLPQEKGHPL